MLKKFIISVLPFLFLMCACGSEKQKAENKKETDTGEPVIVAITRDMPGYFVVGGEHYGYPYELLSAYAESRGREVRLQTGLSRQTLLDNLSTGQADIIVSLPSQNQEEGTISLPLYSTTYVVLASSRSADLYAGHGGSLSRLLGNNIVMTTAGFENTESYDRLLDSLSTALLYISPQGGFDLAKSLSDNMFDLLICEKSEALLAQELLHNVTCVYEFEEQVPVWLVFDGSDSRFYEEFGAWIEEYRATKDFAALSSIYLEKGFGSRFPNINKPNRVVGGISVWDDLVREVGEKEGVDWRLLSAIAYNESRFRTDVESHVGAKGIMQIMPVTARHFNMQDSDLLDPRTSLTIGAKLIKTIGNMLEFTEETSHDDRLSITLAAYNCGIGVVSEARKLASALEEDRNSWASVSKYLVLMGDHDFVAPIEYRYRNFRGSGEALAFVDNVIEKYDVYCSSVK